VLFRSGKRLTPSPSPKERGENTKRGVRKNKENNTLKNKGNESK
jgi:hypothetical protein